MGKSLDEDPVFMKVVPIEGTSFSIELISRIQADQQFGRLQVMKDDSDIPRFVVLKYIPMNAASAADAKDYLRSQGLEVLHTAPSAIKLLGYDKDVPAYTYSEFPADDDRRHLWLPD